MVQEHPQGDLSLAVFIWQVKFIPLRLTAEERSGTPQGHLLGVCFSMHKHLNESMRAQITVNTKVDVCGLNRRILVVNNLEIAYHICLTCSFIECEACRSTVFGMLAA